MTSYRVTFKRIGSNHYVAPLVTQAANADDLCEQWLYRSYGRATRVLNRLAEPGHLYWSAPCGGYHITSLTPAEHDRRQADRLKQTNEGSNP